MKRSGFLMSTHMLTICCISLVAPCFVFSSADAQSPKENIAKAVASKPANSKSDADETAKTKADMGDKEIAALMETVRKKHKLIGLVGGVSRDEKLIALGSCGVRKMESGIAFEANDKVHLGSCTKAFTAALIAMLVEEKLIRWDQTIGETFPELKKEVHADYHVVTVEQLLSHRSGLFRDPIDGIVHDIELSDREKRIELMRRLLKKPSANKPEAIYLYSNFGYMIAGAMAEKVTGKNWQTLIQTRIFDPLQMNSAGFGPPSVKRKMDQPWGHQLNVIGNLFSNQLDNPSCIGPAGTIHLSISDWAKFIHILSSGKETLVNGKPFLTQKSIEKLQTRRPAKHDYAMGWIVAQRKWAGGDAITHGGSNRRWNSVVWVAPKRRIAFYAVTNTGDPKAQSALNDAIVALMIWDDKRQKKKVNQ